jgi:signal transduction histidine kinase
MKLHSATALGFSICSVDDDSSEAAGLTADVPLQSALSATLKLRDQLISVRAIGARADGSFIGEIFANDTDACEWGNGIRSGDQVAFSRTHVFSVQMGTDAAERTRVPTDEQLRSADRTKEQFIATLSQTAPNPLAPLTSTIRFLQTKAPPDLKFAVDLLERQTSHVKRLMNDLLDLSRMQSGTLQIKKRRVDLAWVLHSAIEEARHLFDDKRQHFADRYPQQRIELEADSVRLAEAVSNLLSNASKYTPPDGRIELSVERTAEAISITVIDSGIGIPQSLQEQMFEPFVQGAIGNEGHEGLGIGLALTKTIVELHGGRIEVRSDGPGKGSQFEIRLNSHTSV